MKPSAKQVLQVLSDRNPHSAKEFWNGLHGFTCMAVAQRVTELKREGYRIANVTKDGGVATYQLEDVAA